MDQKFCRLDGNIWHRTKGLHALVLDGGEEKMRRNNSSNNGFALIASAAAASMIFGCAGLAIDIGRLYIAKNEAQSFADSASLYGALEIDGTTAGLTRADSAVAASIQKWNFATTSFTVLS